MDDSEDLFGDDDLGWVKPIDQVMAEVHAEEAKKKAKQQVDEDPNWDHGVAGYSEDEDAEAKKQRKDALKKRHAQESTLGGEEEAPQNEAEKKKKKKSRKETAPAVSLKKHGGMVLMTTAEGVDITVPLPDKLPNQNKHIVNRFGGFVNDSSLALKIKPNTTELHDTALDREEKDIASVVEAFKKGIDLNDFTVNLSLCRVLGSKSKAEAVVKRDQRHHLLSNLPPFKAFNPPCVDPAITKPAGDKTKPLPVCLFKALIEEDIPPGDSAYRCLGGFEAVSGIMPVDVGTEDEPEMRRSLSNQRDATTEPLFRFRSCYSDVSRLFWFSMDARTIAIIHMLMDDLVPLSGISNGVCKERLLPVTRFFNAASFIRDTGVIPWRFGEARCEQFIDAPIKTVQRGLSERKADDVSHDLCVQFCKAVEGVLNVSLMRKEKLFSCSREPARPERSKEFPDDLLAKFVEATPSLADPWIQWLFKIQDLTAKGAIDEAQDYRNLQDRYTAYLAGYLDWRYFMLPEMVLAALAIAYETLHPDFNNTFVIPAVSIERTEISALLRVCEKGRSYKIPAVHMLFYNYYDTCYEKYAAALLLWNFIGNKKVALAQPMIAQKQKQVEKILPPNAKRAHRPYLPKRRFRPHTVAFEMVFHFYGRGEEGSTDQTMMDICMFIEHIREDIKKVYNWNIHPMLCHAMSLNVERAHVFDPTRLDSEQALLDRKAAEAALIEQLKNQHNELPAEWQGRQEEIAKRAVRQGRAVARGVTYSAAIFKDLEKALEIFNSSFDVIKPSRHRKSMNGMHRVNFTAARANNIIWTYMQENDLLTSEDTTRKAIWLFTLTNRRDAPGVEKYTKPRRLVLFSMRKGTPLSEWHYRACHDPEQLEKHGRQL